MADQNALWNIAAWMAQIACVTVLAEILLRLVPVRSAGFRYAYWRAALTAALVMPWLFGAVPRAQDVAPAAGLTLRSLSAEFIDFQAMARRPVDEASAWPAAILAVVAVGVVVRLLWLAAGVARLRRFRRRGVAVVDAAYEEMQRTLGTRAELRSVPGLPQPATFGVRRPVVLLPSELAWSEEATRRAVIAHELVHVHHRDWVWVVAEEMLCAALWFHPAIWWLVSRVQLTREEFTDHVAVLATGSRRAYMEALLAFADSAPVSPAPAFARRPHLFHRLVLLSKEAVMSPRRVLMSGAVLGALLLGGGWYASELFPVAAAQGSAGRQTGTVGPVNSVTPENPIPRRRFATPARYPLELAGSNLVGAIEAQVVLDAGGGVASVGRANVGIAYSNGRRPAATEMSPEQMRRASAAFVAAATEAIQQWQYDGPAQAPLGFWVTMTLREGAEVVVSQSDQSRGVTAVDGLARGGRGAGAGVAGTPAPASEPLRAASGATPLRIGGAIRQPTQTRRVAPAYPPIAQSARVQGVVILEALVNEQGLVEQARVLRSIPLLDQAALDAVRQWEYTPVLLNGVPVPVIMTVTVQFTPQF